MNGPIQGSANPLRLRDRVTPMLSRLLRAIRADSPSPRPAKIEDRHGIVLPSLFALTLFVSSALMFVAEPMVGKMLLPLLGGTPAVWSTCMVFFQAMLLAGYLYAHLSTAWLKVRWQAVLQCTVILLSCLVLPIVIDKGSVGAAETRPIREVLTRLLLSVGLPFFAVSASAPLLQKWFATSDHRAGRDPYFLYSASNLGSMLALLSYPALIEPHLRLKSQGLLWALLYGAFGVLSIGCAIVAVRVSSRTSPRLTDDSLEPAFGRGSASECSASPPPGRRWRWLVLAFLPSSYMLGATAYITTDLASIPLLWVIPLALYLLSLVLAFSTYPMLPRRAPIAVLPCSSSCSSS